MAQCHNADVEACHPLLSARDAVSLLVVSPALRGQAGWAPADPATMATGPAYLQIPPSKSSHTARRLGTGGVEPPTAMVSDDATVGYGDTGNTDGIVVTAEVANTCTCTIDTCTQCSRVLYYLCQYLTRQGAGQSRVPLDRMTLRKRELIYPC